MYYFHARYYNPPTFISRDPLFEKKITSPYAAFRNNPLLYIDPNGEDEYEFDKKGNLVNIISNEKADVVRIVRRNGKEKASKSYEYGTIKEIGKERLNTISNGTGKVDATVINLKDDTYRKDMFEFLAENTKIEWSTISAFNDKEGFRNIISTNHSSGSEISGLSILDFDLIPKQSDIFDFTHSHPNSIFQFSNEPSGYGHRYDGTSKGRGDNGVSNLYHRLIQNIGVYDARDRIYYKLYPNKYKKQ
jgi:hypothetical protein